MKDKKSILDNNTIRWIVGVLVVIHVISLLSATWGIFSTLDSLDELDSIYNLYPEQEDSIERLLTEDGYEVLNVFILHYSADAPFFDRFNITDDTVCSPEEDYCDSDKVLVSVVMKSLGSREEQIMNVLSSSYVVFENAFTYNIGILSPTDRCDYLFFGFTIREYFDTFSPEAKAKIDLQIEELTVCS